MLKLLLICVFSLSMICVGAIIRLMIIRWNVRIIKNRNSKREKSN